MVPVGIRGLPRPMLVRLKVNLDGERGGGTGVPWVAGRKRGERRAGKAGGSRWEKGRN